MPEFAPPPEADSRWFLIGKLAPPTQRVMAARRDSLIQRLNAGLTRPLTVMVSPPGFGKTTLLTQWFQSLQAAGTTAAGWLSLDEADSESSRFVAGLILAVSRAGVEVGALEIAARQQNIDTSLEPIIGALLAAIHKAARPVVVVLDDYHRASAPAVDRVIESIIEHSQGELHLVVSGRQRPTFHVSALSVRGLVSSFVASDLVLSQAEAAEVFGADVASEDLALLYARTEGWAVALQLARLWLDRGHRKPDTLRDFSGRTAEMGDYLVEQIVRDLPEDLRDFLLETCVLERFDADLADAVRNRTDSASILERLTDFDALLVPLDGEGDWLRYHPLFADFLLQRLKRGPADRIAQLHRRAAGWLAKAGDLQQAVRHATLADDTSLALELTQDAGGWELILTRGVGYVRSLLTHFAATTIRSAPVLQLTQAYLDLKLGQDERARDLLRQTEAQLGTAGARVARDYAVVDALRHGLTDDLTDRTWLSALEAQVQSFKEDDHLGRGTLLSVVAGGAMAHGDSAMSERASRIAIQEMRAARSVLGTNYLFLHLAQSQFLQGRLREGEGLFREALVLAEENFGADSGLRAFCEMLLAQCLYLKDDLEGASALIESSLRIVESSDGWVDVFATAYEVAARQAFDSGGLEAALRVVARATQTARERKIARLGAITAAWTVEFLALSGHIREARREARVAGLAEQVEVRGKPGFSWRVRLAATLSLARLSQASGDARYALRILDGASEDFRAGGLALPAWRLDALSVMALKQTRQDGEAITRVERLLDFILAEGASRLVLEHGTALESVLLGAQRRNRELVLSAARRELTTQLLARLQREHLQDEGGFSSRELEVLRELCNGHSNKTIGQLLDLSENTVKFHLKQVFRKLGVESRVQAVAVSRDRGLIGAGGPRKTRDNS